MAVQNTSPHYSVGVQQYNNDYVDFQQHCGTAPYNHAENQIDAHNYELFPKGDEVLIYPQAGVSISFSGRHKDHFTQFDEVTFFSWPNMKILDEATAMERLGCQ